MQEEHNHEFERAYGQEVFENREKELYRQKYAQEKRVNVLITNGEVEKLQEMFSSVKLKEVGKMSHNSFRQQLYAIIIGIAVATRAAMEGGLYEETAYTLSDIYIQKADACNSADELWKLYVRMMIDFAQKVRESKSKDKSNKSEAVQSSIQYILRHLHYDLVLKNIAQQAGLSETYFSTLFKKETGNTVSEFIQKSRVDEAKSLLQYSEYSLLEISQYLGFCSQSHFAQTFRRYEQVTPGQYRKVNFKKTW